MSQWSNARNILCVRLDGMGSVLMTTPALRALKQAVPDRSLTLLTSPAGASVAAYLPEVDQVITYDAPWLKGANTHDAMADKRMISRLDAADYDAAVIFTARGENVLPAAMLCLMADIPLRLAHSAENPHLLLTDWVREAKDKRTSDKHYGRHVRHEVQRQLDLVASIGARAQDQRLGFALSDADHGSLMSKLRRRGVDLERPWLVLHPGTLAAGESVADFQDVEQRGFEKYAATLQGLQSHLDCQILLTGGAQEIPLCHALQESGDYGATSLAGELSLGEFGALIAHSAVLLSNGSASVHIAAAVGTPVVDLQARMQPQQTPWQVPSRVLSTVDAQGDASDCLARLDPQDMISAVCELWQERGQQPAQPHRAAAASRA
ncbi:glycosyltransferase family 9 protein [Uliginosibacterium sp. H3]|uniref:Glycosyltransferase family 9 protein n=1 Tax=Uliginosibacterium silvisoli TaxID=3114758 RepID=A0ABU6JYF0_9RHOO|nr:glycosyltransferase family 9 protein [Uliginosibacterium sp. H3]